MKKSSLRLLSGFRAAVIDAALGVQIGAGGRPRREKVFQRCKSLGIEGEEATL